MELTSKTVFVLGAGFTKAFVPNAPLLEDDYDGKKILEDIKNFKHANKILENELKLPPEDKINLERLMTRLHSQMPYDDEHGALDEFNILLRELQNKFEHKLDKAKAAKFYSNDIATFAELCVEEEIICITFNYDDVLDKALWEVKEVIGTPNNKKKYWHPDGGYGFYCQPSNACIENISHGMDETSMYLLKLHGSINWKIRKGSIQPYSLNALVHHQKWLPLITYSGIPINDKQRIDIERHLKKISIIVPPLLTKEVLVNEPVLRLIWSLAFDALKNAEQVVFVGYSLPITDIASGFLFSEAIPKSCEIKVVNIASKEDEKSSIREAYKKIFPNIKDNCFEFIGALDWTKNLVKSAKSTNI